jgi:muramoyltetrapeptide carboxypeptidase
VLEDGRLRAAAIESRVRDVHAAFADPDVAAVLTVLGGYNSNQVLPYLDYRLIAEHPKVFCGYSDITAMNGAILARSGLVTYCGPHFSTFAMRDHLERTVDSFRRCLFSDRPLEWSPSPAFTDDKWYHDQDDRAEEPTDGWWLLQPGAASGRLIGGNLVTFNVLNGTPYRPSLAESVMFIEDDLESAPRTFDRELSSLLQQSDLDLRGLVIGRFQHATGMTRELLSHIVSTKRELAGIPVLANVDFGHTNPLYTFPMGGECWIAAEPGAIEIVLTRH